jgi:hypothetical protein
MAAAIINVETVLEAAKLGMNDNDSAGPFWIPNTKYQQIIAAAVCSTESTWTFQKYSATLYKVAAGLEGMALWFTSDTAPFGAGQDNVTYEVSCMGTIIITAGTCTATSFSVLACRVDYAKMMCDLNMYLAQHRALQIANNNNQVVGDTYRYFMDVADQWSH